MRVLVCGGRDFDDWKLLSETLQTKLSAYTRGLVIIQGEAKGADFLAKVWAKWIPWDTSVESYPADWKTYGKVAGCIRNQKMLDEGKPDLVIAFPGGTGTADMVRRAKNAGVKVVEV